jgi:hypothetical protein
MLRTSEQIKQSVVGSVPDWYTFHAVFQTAMFTAGAEKQKKPTAVSGL